MAFEKQRSRISPTKTARSSTACEVVFPEVPHCACIPRGTVTGQLPVWNDGEGEYILEVLSSSGWSPILAVETSGSKSALKFVAWTGGQGAIPPSPALPYLGPSGFTDFTGATNIRGADGSPGTPGTPGSPGAPGTNGTNGWSPVFAVETVGVKSALRLISWTGGSGSAPAVPANAYVGPSGFTDFAGASNVQGPAGPAGPGQIPLGGIILWSGSVVPVNYALCDGGTYNGIVSPDLRGRFVVGLQPGSPTFGTIGNTGGASSVTLASGNIPQLSVTGARANQVLTDTPGADPPIFSGIWAPGPNGFIINRTVTSGVVGNASPTAVSTLPPYYTLAYIIRVA